MVADFESGIRLPNEDYLKALRTALEAAGVMFLDEDAAAGIGVRLRRQPGP
jgi:hypothetical protein